MPSSLFHSCFSCIALSSLFFADLLHGGLDDAFHQPVQVHQPALSPLPLVCVNKHRNPKYLIYLGIQMSEMLAFSKYFAKSLKFTQIQVGDEQQLRQPFYLLHLQVPEGVVLS